MMEGAECCNLLSPPFCVDQQPSMAVVAAITPFAILLLLFGGSILPACCLKKRGRAESEADLDCVSTETGIPQPVADMSSKALEANIRACFEKSPLRVLPGAESLRESIATLFSSLCATYSFQA